MLPRTPGTKDLGLQHKTGTWKRRDPVVVGPWWPYPWNKTNHSHPWTLRSRSHRKKCDHSQPFHSDHPPLSNLPPWECGGEKPWHQLQPLLSYRSLSPNTGHFLGFRGAELERCGAVHLQSSHIRTISISWWKGQSGFTLGHATFEPNDRWLASTSKTQAWHGTLVAWPWKTKTNTAPYGGDEKWKAHAHACVHTQEAYAMTGERFNAHDQGLQKEYAQDLWFLESSPLLWLFQSKTMQYNGWQTPKFSAGTRVYIFGAQASLFASVFCVCCLWHLGGGKLCWNVLVFLGVQKACWRGCFRFQVYSRVAEGA